MIHHIFLHVVLVRKDTDIRELHAFRVQFSNVRVFSDSRNVQKSLTRIIYLGPLPKAQQLVLDFFLSILELLELRQDFICPRRAGQL